MNELIDFNSLTSLIDYGADANIQDLFGKIPLHYASENSNFSYEMMQLLLEYSDPNEKGKGF
jgi:ankyrin repeat protein